MYYRASLNVVTLCQFLKELCLFLNLENRKCVVFCTFLLHALTYYWGEILHMTLFWCTTDQVRVSLHQFLKELCLFWNLGNLQFSAHFSYMLWHIELKFCTRLSFNVLQIKFECRTLCQFLKELCPFVNWEYRKCAVFRTFLLHALRYWDEILHMTLF